MARLSIFAATVWLALWVVFSPAPVDAQANRYSRFNRSSAMFGAKRFGQPFRPPESRFGTGLDRSASGAFLGINRPTGNLGSRGALRTARETRSTQWLMNPPPQATESFGGGQPPTTPRVPASSSAEEGSATSQEGSSADLSQSSETMQGPQFPEGQPFGAEPLGTTAEGSSSTIPATSGQGVPGGEAATGAGQGGGVPSGVGSPFAQGFSDNNLPPVTRWSSSYVRRRQHKPRTSRTSLRLLGNEQLAQALTMRIERALGQSLRQPVRVRIDRGIAIVEGAVTSEDRRAVITNLLLFEPGISQVDNRVTVQRTDSAGEE